MTDAKPATEYANRICDDDALYSELHELLKRTNTSDAQRLKDVLDEATLQNIVCAITEGSDAIQKRIDTERAARLAAEARVKEMDEVLRKCLDYVLDTTPFANGPDTPLSKRIRAALKETANV